MRLRRRARAAAHPGGPRLLVPFAGAELDPAVLAAALRIARADGAVVVPAYLLVVPYEYSMESPLTSEVEVALPMLEAVEMEALKAGVAVDARLERGRSLRDALRRLWDAESFDRILVPVMPELRQGFSEQEIAWVLTHAPTETLALRPASHAVPEPA